MPWSDWQDGFNFTEPAEWQDGSGAANGTRQAICLFSRVDVNAFSASYPSFAAAEADLTSKLADCTAPSTPVTGLAGDSGFGQFFQIEDAVFFGRTAIGLSVQARQWVATFIDPGYAFFDPAPPLPPEAIDYEFEAGPSVRVGWADWVLNKVSDGYTSQTYSSSVNQGPEGIPNQFWDDWQPYLSFRVVDPSDVSYADIYGSEIGGHGGSNSYPTTSWPAAAVGTETGRITDPTSTSGIALSDGPVTIPLDQAGTLGTFTMLIQPGTVLDGIPPTLHEPTHYPGDTFRAAEADDEWRFFSFGGFRPRPPNVVYRTPRWRYLIPDQIYTVGGHWADPNGVPVMRLKDDGVTWIPIVDGLAPPLRP